MRFVSIASGSSGNCIYAGSDHTHLLVDAGISGKRIENGLNEIGVAGNEVDGILITHEHSDHISGLGVLSRKFGIPIYGTKETLQAVAGCNSLGKIPDGLFREIEPDSEVIIGDMRVLPFSTAHDAANPCSYRIESNGRSVAVVTDLGNYSQYTVSRLLGLDALLLEANHDVHMLQAGPYPYYLKRRIMSNQGHLSNESAGQLLCELLHDGLKRVLLGHLSKENNYADLAYETVRLEITMGDNPYNGNDFHITVAGRDRMSDVVYL